MKCYNKLVKYAKRDSFLLYIQNVMNQLEEQLAITFNEIVEWLSHDYVGPAKTWNDIKLELPYREANCKLHELAYPCDLIRFRNKYKFDYDYIFDGKLVKIYADYIYVDRYYLHEHDWFDIYDIANAFSENFEGTCNIINMILHSGVTHPV